MPICKHNCEQPCEDCDCAGPVEDPETPNLDLLRQLNALQNMIEPNEPVELNIDRENADLYAFSSIELKTLREGKEAENQKEWSSDQLKQIVLQVIGNKLDV